MIGEDVDLEDGFKRDFKGINPTTSGKDVFDKSLLIKKFALQGRVILPTPEKRTRGVSMSC